MPGEEHKELRELVTRTLQAKGVLEKVQAEIRASVFLALEEQDVFKDKSPFINKPLQEFVATSEGLLAISLIREFLEFFNLEFTAMVFDPETHAGINYSYEGRTKLAEDLMIELSDNKKLPLLALLLKLIKSSSKNMFDLPTSKITSLKLEDRKEADISEQSGHNPSLQNGLNGSSHEEDDLNIHEVRDCESLNLIDLNKSDENTRLDLTKGQPPDSSSVATLSKLPPLARTSSVPSQDFRETPKDVSSVFDLDAASEDELQLSSESDKLKKDKIETGSEASEVEEEISENFSESLDDNTIDIAISRASDKGDYMEDL